MVKAYAIGFFGAVLAILVVGGAWLAFQPSQTAGLVWGGTVYTSKQEFKGYLRSKGLSYEKWIARNPGAAPWESATVRASTAAAHREGEDWVARLPLARIGLMSATGGALLLLLRGRTAAAAAAAARAHGSRRTRPRAPGGPRQVESEAAVVARPVERSTRSAAASDGPSMAVAEPTRVTPRQADSSLVETLSPRLRLDERVEQGDQDDTEVAASGPQMCEIHLWRGYVKSQFYVEADPPLDRLIESRAFRTRGSDLPEESDVAVAAYDALGDALVAAGWERDGRGAHWFSDRFRRRF